MSLRAWLKSKTADRVLLPLRQQVAALIPSGSRVLEVGCGTGALLRTAAPHIQLGHGIDRDAGMVDFAQGQAQALGLDHLHFQVLDAVELDRGFVATFHVAAAVLCLHAMPAPAAVTVLHSLCACHGPVIIADYVPAPSPWERRAVEMDELVSGHYRQFRAYRRLGGVPALAERAGAVIVETVISPLESVVVWVLAPGR